MKVNKEMDGASLNEAVKKDLDRRMQLDVIDDELHDRINSLILREYLTKERIDNVYVLHRNSCSEAVWQFDKQTRHHCVPKWRMLSANNTESVGHLVRTARQVFQSGARFHCCRPVACAAWKRSCRVCLPRFHLCIILFFCCRFLYRYKY